MAPNSWTTPEEREFLKTFLPDYEACQVKRKYKLFWQRLNREYFAKFSLVEKLFPGLQVTELNAEQKKEYSAAVVRQQKVSVLFSRMQSHRLITRGPNPCSV